MTFSTTPKAWSIKEVIGKLIFIKINNSALLSSVLREWEDKSQNVRKYLQKTQLSKDYYLKYVKKTS